MKQYVGIQKARLLGTVKTGQNMTQWDSSNTSTRKDKASDDKYDDDNDAENYHSPKF